MPEDDFVEENPDMQYRIITRRDDGKLVTTIDLFARGNADTLNNLVRRFSHSSVDMQEKHIWTHLVDLGWTPPAIIQAKLEEFVEDIIDET